MTRATFHAWLSGSKVVAPASCLAYLVIAVRSLPAEEWLIHRLRPVMERTLAGLAGYRLDVFFLSDSYAKEQPARLSPEQLPGVLT